MESTRRRSRWLMRVQEWYDLRAPYPNVWRGGMPRHVLASEAFASRLKLGDLVAVYYPSSAKYPQRSERFVGLARVTGLRRADDVKFAWVDFETAWRFDPPLDLGEAPRRVFLCSDPGWPDTEVRLFRRVVDAAVAGGWVPARDERETETPAPPVAAPEPGPAVAPVAEPSHTTLPPSRRWTCFVGFTPKRLINSRMRGGIGNGRLLSMLMHTIIKSGPSGPSKPAKTSLFAC